MALQMLTAGSSPKVPNVDTLGSFVGDKPTGYGPTGYDQKPTVTPYTSAGSIARAGIGTGGATNTVNPPAPKTTSSSSGGDNTGGGSGSDPSQAYNLDTDPIVAKIKALNAQNYGSAVAHAQASAKDALIGAGFNVGDLLTSHPELAQGILGQVLADQATQLAAQQNPFSTAANLALAHTRNVQGIDQNTNANNLYYSSARGNQLGDEAHSYLGNVSAAQQALAQTLGGYLQDVLNEQSTENANLANAYDQARQTAVNNAISGGEVFAGYDANGNPIFTNAPAATTTTGGGTDTSGGSAPPPPPTLPQPTAAQIAAANKLFQTANKKNLGF